MSDGLIQIGSPEGGTRREKRPEWLRIRLATPKQYTEVRDVNLADSWYENINQAALPIDDNGDYTIGGTFELRSVVRERFILIEESAVDNQRIYYVHREQEAYLGGADELLMDISKPIQRGVSSDRYSYREYRDWIPFAIEGDEVWPIRVSVPDVSRLTSNLPYCGADNLTNGSLISLVLTMMVPSASKTKRQQEAGL